MGVVYFSIIPTFEPSRYCKCWIVCFYSIIMILETSVFIVLMVEKHQKMQRKEQEKVDIMEVL